MHLPRAFVAPMTGGYGRGEGGKPGIPSRTHAFGHWLRPVCNADFTIAPCRLGKGFMGDFVVGTSTR